MKIVRKINILQFDFKKHNFNLGYIRLNSPSYMLGAQMYLSPPEFLPHDTSSSDPRIFSGFHKKKLSWSLVGMFLHEEESVKVCRGCQQPAVALAW